MPQWNKHRAKNRARGRREEEEEEALWGERPQQHFLPSRQRRYHQEPFIECNVEICADVCVLFMSREVKTEPTAAEVRGHREKGSCAYVCVCGGHSNSEASWGHLWKSTQAPPLPVQRHVQAHKQHRSHNCYFIYLLSISHRFS